ncbi:AAA family ATPase [bacterium]|nr:AAA family ATPase [bacterium]
MSTSDLHTATTHSPEVRPVTGSIAAPSAPVVAPHQPQSVPGGNGLRGNSVRRALQFAEPITPQGLVLAWRRQWRTAVAFGVPLTIVAVVAAWFAMPAPYTAYALLKIDENAPRLVFSTAEGEDDFFTFRQTQMALVKSRFVLNAALRRPGISDLRTLRGIEHPVEWLQNVVKVGTYNSPEILQMALSGEHPEELSALVNAVKDAYLDEVVLADRKKRIARVSELEQIYNETEEKVRKKEERVEHLARQLGTGDSAALSIKHQMALEQISLLRREHARVRFELMQAQIHQQSVAEISESRKGDPGASRKDASSLPAMALPASAAPGQTVDPRVAFATSRVAQLKDLIARYEQQVVDQNHPTLTRYREELAEMERVAAGLSPEASAEPVSRLEMLAKQERALREELDKYSELVNSIGTSSFELELMKTEIEQIAKVSDKVGGEMEALRIELKSPTRVTLLQEADVPQTRDTGKKTKLTAAAGIGSLGMVFLIVAVMEFRARRITDPKDVAQTLGLELLGALPAMPRPLLQFWKSPKDARINLWNNALIESVDTVRSILLHAPDADQKQVLMIVSAAPGEGKTTFACQLAGSLARAGRKTVLVDFDLRKPRAHTLLNVPLELGLCELLSEKLDTQTVIHKTSQDCLDVIPAGRVNEDALAALARNGASWLFKELRKEYEFVIVDSSPVLYVADGGTVGSNVDGAIIAVRSHLSRLPAVAVACERVERFGIDLIDAVMVGVRSNLSGYGYSYDYHYGPAEPTA